MHSKNLLIMLMMMLLLTSTCIYAQTAQKDISTGNIATRVKNAGDFITDKFFAPKTKNVGTIFTSSLWLSGKNSLDSTLAALTTYRQGGYGFVPGPYSPVSDQQVNIDRYDYLWRVSQCEINNHKLLYNQPGYVIPNDILTWPAHGDVSKGEPAQIAPYYDKNGNATYEPSIGEYPIIKGDEAILYVINDNAGSRKYIKSLNFNVDIVGMVYAYKSNSNNIISNTIFIDNVITNRSNEKYTNFKAGFFVDFDLGFFSDDYVGCSQKENIFYALNGDNLDEGGYGNKLVTQGALFLTDSMTGFMYYNNDNSLTGEPINKEEVYNYMNATWKDNTKVTYGGTGYNTGSSNFTNYMFPSNPKDILPTAWSEHKANNIPADRRGLGYMTKGDFTPGESFKTTLALLFSPNEQYQSVDSLLIKAKILRSNYKKYERVDTSYALTILGNATFCAGDSVQLQAPVGFNYQWSTGATGRQISVKNTGNFYCVLADSLGCIYFTDTISCKASTFNPQMTVSSIELFIGDTLQASINIQNATYQWDFADGNTENTQNVQHTWIKPGKYDVSCVVSDSSCSAVIIKTILVKDTASNPQSTILIPNALNIDGSNLLFTPVFKNCEFKSIDVYNRWGQLCYKSTVNSIWNGKSDDNKDLPTGTYIILIKAMEGTNNEIINTQIINIL